MRRVLTLADITFLTALWVAPPVSVASDIEAQAGTSCRVTADSARRLELPDGRPVSIDVRSIAVSGGVVMAVGEHAYVFPRPSGPRLSPERRDFIGVTLDRRGRLALVHSPLPEGEILHPRVAPGPDGSFHVLFATAGDSTTRLTAPDTASVWYARFANGAWLRPERVMGVRDAELDPEFTSALLENNGALTFLMPLRDHRNSAGGAVLLLRRRHGAWSSDTLRTPGRLTAVRAVHTGDGEELLGLLTQRTESGPRGEDVLLVRFDSAWSVPRRIGGDAEHTIADRALVRLGDEFAAAWSRWKPLQDETSVVEWVRLRSDGRLTNVTSVGSGSATYPFEMTGVDDRYPLWLFRGEPYGSAARLALGSDSVAVSLGQIDMPLENPRPKAVALAATRFLVFSMKQGRRDGEPMVASYTTTLEIRCPRSARR